MCALPQTAGHKVLQLMLALDQCLIEAAKYHKAMLVARALKTVTNLGVASSFGTIAVLSGAVFCISLSWTTASNAAEALRSFGNWSVFVEATPPPKTCWTATKIIYDPKAEQTYFLAVSRYRGRRDAEVSIYSDKRMSRSRALYLTVSGREYRLRSDGTSAWPEKKADKRIISDMLEVSRSKAPSDRTIAAGQKGRLEFRIRIDGFGPALERAISECSRP